MNPTPLLLRAFPVACVLSLLSLTTPLHADPALGAIKERQEKVLNVVKLSGAAVVNVSGIGSGVIVSKDGLVLTAGHVAEAVDAKPFINEHGEFDITLADGKEVKAKALGRNMDRDAALLQITTPGEYPVAEMADAKTIHQGDWCVAMGHPGGYLVDRSAPVRTGRLWQKDEEKCYRTDCTVSGGDSGGPLFDLSGKVIGIHSSIGERLEENRHVPISAFQTHMEKMKAGKKWGQLANLMPELAPFDRAHGQNRDEAEEAAPTPKSAQQKNSLPRREAAPTEPRPFLGVVFDGQAEQATISEIAPNSPADDAGLKLDDVITKIDGKNVADGSAAVDAVRGHQPGDKLKITISRAHETQELSVTLGKK